jgi:hypothetical protein
MEEPTQNQTIETTQTKSSRLQKMRSFIGKRKVLLALGIAVAVIIIIAIIWALVSNSKKPSNQTSTPSLPGSILFSPASVEVVPGGMGSADIMINTGGNPVIGAEIAISYNPKLISEVTLTPFKDTHSALSYALNQIGENQIYDDGMVMNLKLPASTPPQSGIGKVAVLHFTVKKVNVAINSTVIKLLPITNFFVKEGATPISTSRNTLQINFAQNTSPQTASDAAQRIKAQQQLGQ